MKCKMLVAFMCFGLTCPIARADFAQWTNQTSGFLGDATFSIGGLSSPSLTSSSDFSITADPSYYNPVVPSGTQLLQHSVNDNFTITLSQPVTLSLYLMYYRAPYSYTFSQTPTIVSGLSGSTVVGDTLTVSTFASGVLRFSSVSTLTVSSSAFETEDFSQQIFTLYTGVASPSAADTQLSLRQSELRLRGIFNLQSAALINGLNYDCRLFDIKNICLSTGGRHSNNHGAFGHSSSALLIGAYRLNKNTRLGAWVDQNLSSSMVTGMNLSNSKPLFGVFGAWAESPSGEGYEVKVSAGYGDKDLGVTRDVIGTSEPGFGGTRLNSQAISTVSSYGFILNKYVLVSPYVGVQYSRVASGAYAESTTSEVTTPLSYGRLRQENISLLAGLKLLTRLDFKTSLFGSVGLEQNIKHRGGQYSATGIDGLAAINFNANVQRTRSTASAGLSYDIDKKQRVTLSGIYRDEAFHPTASTSVFAIYTVGL